MKQNSIPIIIITITLLLQANLVWSQLAEASRILKHHNNGQVSAIEIPEKPGHAWVKIYNNKGQQILKVEKSRITCLCAVTIKYYPNGQAKEVVQSCHPDAGIQWWKTTWAFDATGNLLKTNKINHSRLEDLFGLTNPD